MRPEVEPYPSGSGTGEAQESATGLREQAGAWIYGSCTWLSEDLDGLCIPSMPPYQVHSGTSTRDPGIWLARAGNKGTAISGCLAAAGSNSFPCMCIPPSP